MAKKLPCIICGEMTYFTSLCDDCMEGNLNADEVWKPIEGYERYQISNYGRVQSFRQGRYIQGFMAHGYRQVNLINNGKKIFPSVHRLVAEYFIPNPEKFTFVRHKDGNKLNNYYRNIEWIPNDDRFSVLAGNKNPQSRPVIQMDKDGNFIQRYANASVAFKKTGIKVNNIHSVCYGRSRLAKGYRWKFER